MKDLKIIAAIGKNNELGMNNNLIWDLKKDLKFFRDNTMGHPIVMGYNTFLSLPKLLPGRKHIVLTHNDTELPDAVSKYDNIKKLLNDLKEYNDDVYVIGGASIYSQFIDYANELILTEIDATEENADVFFPEINNEEWDKEFIDEQEEKGIAYKHVKYRRK